LTNSICPAFIKDKFGPSKFVLHAEKTSLEDLKLSFLRRYKSRPSKFVLLEKRDKFSVSKFVLLEKRDKFRVSKFVLLEKRTDFEL